MQKKALKIKGTRSIANIFTSDKSFFFFLIIFRALIDNPNNFEINRRIRLVVSGMFLLPYFALLLSFASF